MTRLKLHDLAEGLRGHQARYVALDVFADDVEEVVALSKGRPVPGLTPVDAEGNRFQFQDGERFELQLLPDTGVARVTRAKKAPDKLGAALVGGVAGAAIMAAVTKKGDGWLVGLVLGMLAGAILGNPLQPNVPDRVFTLRFDPTSRKWAAYEGGLVKWMKHQLLPAA